MRAQEFIIKGNVEEAIAPGIDTVASVKKLWQYANRNLIDLTSMASFENEHKKQPYVEDRLVNLLKTADGKPVTIAFDMNGSLEFENNVLYIPIGIMWKYRGIISGPEFVKKVVNFLSNQSGMTEGATVTRIDSKPVTDFASGLKAYKHTDDWSQSGLDTGDDSYWKNKNLKTNTTKGLFAGDPRRTALYATGNAHETRYVEFTQNGQPIVYFDQKDLPAMRSRKTYLTVFDASDFRQLPTGEWFSENPGKPIKQIPISDPFKYIASQGWIVRVTDDLDKVFKQVKNMHKAGKIAQYGAEGMNESKQGVAEDLTEVVDLDTAFPLKWDQQFAAQGEIHAAATDADGREIGISFTPAGNGEVTDVAFTRGGTHEMTGRGDAGRVMATVIKAINIYANKYKPPYLAFSAKSGGGRSSAYTAMIRRYAQGYELVPADRYPAALNNYLEFIGTDQPFVLART